LCKKYVFVIGLNPAKSGPRLSPSIKKLNAWMDFCGIKYFSFTNICSYEKFNKNKIDIDFINNCLLISNEIKTITLGNEADIFLKNVNHFSLPHPSPLNRKLNNKEYEQKVLNDLKNYIESDK
jgi:hypothetical protein